MKKVSRNITSCVAGDEQIMLYLETTDHEMIPHAIEIAIAIENPPPFIEALYDHSAAPTSGWSTVGNQSAGMSLWSFWKNGLDLDHLRSLQNQPPRQVHVPVATIVNRFEALEVASPPQLHVELENDEHADPLDDMMSHLYQAPEGQSWEDMSDTDDDTASIDTPIETPSPVTPIVTAAHALQEKEVFLEFFNMRTLPQIPTTNRQLVTLLRDRDIWLFSYEERARVAGFISSQAKMDLDEGSIALFESLTRRHAEARSRLEEARNNASVLKDRADGRSESPCFAISSSLDVRPRERQSCRRCSRCGSD
jgi:hypothetical protein